MIVSKITVQHFSNIFTNQSGIIYGIDTRTNTPFLIQYKNTNNFTLAFGITYNNIFISQAIYSSDFTSEANNTNFSFQSKQPYLVFTDYISVDANNFVITKGLSSYDFSVTSVTVPDLPQVPQNLPLINRTDINNESKIKFCNSPLFIRHSILGLEKSIKVSLFVWDGSQNKVLDLPSETLRKEKVSSSDTYISIEISDLIKPYIKPKFAYNRAFAPAITNQGVFVQAVIETDLGVKTFTPTYFCTLGYRWNYEQNIIGDNGVENYGADGFLETVEKWYSPKIGNYFFQDFDFTKTVANANTANVVKYNPITPTKLRCTLDPSLIVFINKLGLWETFTPHGKFTATTQSKRVDSNISHRDPSQVDNTYIHSRVNNSLEVKQSYLINTGSLDENMTSIIEEIIYSPRLYLIRFRGDIELVTTVGITIDSTLVTIDNTNITIDSQTISSENIGNLKTFNQIPVIVTDEDFTRKTRLNDKIAIDYNLKFDATTNKINNIR